VVIVDQIKFVGWLKVFCKCGVLQGVNTWKYSVNPLISSDEPLKTLLDQPMVVHLFHVTANTLGAIQQLPRRVDICMHCTVTMVRFDGRYLLK
jgi:hypothetical protein